MNTIGTYRPLSWALVWANMGHSITVLTSDKISIDGPLDLKIDLKNIRVISVRNNSLMKAFSPGFIRILKQFRLRFPGLLLFGQPRNIWYKKSKDFIKNSSFDFDMMISTSGPIASHLIASSIKVKNPKIFWICDYRDLWSQLTVLKVSYIEKHLARIFEQRVVKNSEMITCVSHGMSKKLGKLHKKYVYVSFNGFEGSVNTSDLSFNKKLVSNYIIYTGSFIDGYHDISLIVFALRQFNLTHNKRVILKVYGTKVHGIKKFIEENNIDEVVEFLGYHPKDEIEKSQRYADFCLLLSNSRSTSDGDISGKFFEYLKSLRPIICTNAVKFGELDQLLKLTGCGINIDSIKEIVKILEEFYLDFKYPEFYKPNIDYINSFSRSEQASQLINKAIEIKDGASFL